MRRTENSDIGEGTKFCLVEDVGDEDVETATRAAINWAWDCETVRTARTGDGGLLIDFSDPVRTDELGKLRAVLRQGHVRLVEEPRVHDQWTVVWQNVPE